MPPSNIDYSSLSLSLFSFFPRSLVWPGGPFGPFSPGNPGTPGGPVSPRVPVSPVAPVSSGGPSC